MSNGQLIFLGSKAAGLRICNRLLQKLPAGALAAIICPDDRSDPRNVMSEFERAAQQAEVPFHVAPTRAATVELLRRYSPQAAIVHGWYQIIPTSDVPDTPFFGFHYSPLPRYRGNAPLVWQILKGEDRIGVSFFELVAEMDAGRLYDQAFDSLSVDETIADALGKADALAERMLDSFVADWLAGSITLRSQPDVDASYCGLRTPEDGRIDWTRSGASIHDFVRAQTRPYPGAFTALPDGRRLVVWRSAREPRDFIGVPGAIAEVAGEFVVVTAGSGAIRLIEVQVEGEPPAPAPAVLRSLKLRLG